MKRKKMTSTLPLPPSFSLLPDEITMTFLARVPRSNYPKLSLVSKTFMSILSSTDLYVARSRLRSTEQCIYLCIWTLDSNRRNIFQWITLSINPNRTKKTTIEQLPFPIPSPSCATAANPTIVGSEIYVIGGYVSFSSAVRVLDCLSHTWRNAPSINVPRQHHVSCVYDGKIYLIGGVGSTESSSPSFGEVFDIKNQTWKRLPEPGFGDLRYHIICNIAGFEGKIYFGDAITMKAYYDTKQCKWEAKSVTFPSTECVMDNVSYSFRKHDGRYNLWWRDVTGGDINEVKGLDSFGNRYKRRCGSSHTTTKTTCCGRKLYVVWEGYAKKNNPNKMMKIWCAEISVEKHDGDEIW